MYSYDYRIAGRIAGLCRRLFFAMSLDHARTVLGLPPSFTPEQLQKAYKKKVIENHPDRGGDHRKMVEVNVAKEILDGHRPYSIDPPTPPPKKDPEAERREYMKRKKDQSLMAMAHAAKEAMEALEPALRECDFPHGRLHIPSFLTHDYAQVLHQIHDQIDADQAKHPDVMKAKALSHTLMGMATRLAARASAITKRHGEAYANLLGMGGDLTFKEVAVMQTDMAKFISAFAEFATESGNLMKLIMTSENVPVAWDDLYHKPHQVILSFKKDFEDYSLMWEGRSLKEFGKRLQRAVETALAALGDHGLKMHGSDNWETWRLPGDFMKAAEMIKNVNVN